MREHPIIFSTGMVRAIREGRKTMTRRIVRGHPYGYLGHIIERDKYFFSNDPKIISQNDEPTVGTFEIRCPYGKIGDILWVRETWCNLDEFELGYKLEPNYLFGYKADLSARDTVSDFYFGTINWNWDSEKIKWRPSIFMPHEAARIFLEVTNIRVERLHDITEEDICFDGGFIYSTQLVDDNYAENRFKNLWNSINKKRGYGWETNPFVWVIEFKQINSPDKPVFGR
jgi:hypothetical protein